MRHMSRTHRVALDWLFDRIDLDPEIQITYVDTKNQLADMLTKVNFTRDEWNHFLRLFNNMSFSMFSCSHISPIDNPKTMSKRQMQEGKLGQEEILVAQSNLKVSFLWETASQSPTALGSSASHSQGHSKHTVRI